MQRRPGKTKLVLGSQGIDGLGSIARTVLDVVRLVEDSTVEIDGVQNTILFENSILALEAGILLPPVGLEDVVGRKDDVVVFDLFRIGQARRTVMNADREATTGMLFNLGFPLHDGDSRCDDEIRLDVGVGHEKRDGLNSLAHSHFYKS